MRRKNLVVRANKKKLPTQDLKVKNLYKNFRKIIVKKINKKNFAIAVSGGSDSLCLAYLGKIYKSEFKSKIHFLIVNHKIRSESKREAIKVKKILNTKGIKSKILNWNGEIPRSNIQKKARNIRYSLISKYCVKNKIKYLLTAHHMDDQIENFFIRLFRGSGLTGLSSMSETFNYSNNLKIIRPLLDYKKEDLKYITLKYFKNYIRDPSNDNERYLRVKIRKQRKNLDKEGLDTGKIIRSINNLVLANKALTFYKNKALHKHVSFSSKKKCVINTKILSEEPDEIIFKSFADIFSLIGGSYYPPRSKKIVDLINRIKRKKYKKSTLGGCIIDKKDGSILISKESRSS